MLVRGRNASPAGAARLRFAARQQGSPRHKAGGGALSFQREREGPRVRSAPRGRPGAGCVREHPRLCPRPSRPRPRQHPKARAAGSGWGLQQGRCAHPGGRRGLAWTRSPQVEQGEEEPAASTLQGLPLWSLLAASWFFHSANSPRPVKRQALYHWSRRRTPAAVCRPCGSHKGQPHEGAAVGPQLPSVGRVV